MTVMKKEKIIGLTGVVILAGLLLVTLLTVKTNFSLKDDLNKEKLSSEQLLASKLQLQKEIDKNKTDQEALRKRFMDLTSKNDQVVIQLNEKERRINSLYAENSNLKKTNKELSEIRSQKDDLERKYAELRTDTESIKSKLTEKENLILSLQDQMNDLAARLETNLCSPDNFQVTATKGKKKERLTIVAARTRKLAIDFEIPVNMADNINFRVITPSGQTINPDDKSLTWIFPENTRNLTASLSALSGEFEESRQVKLTYSSSAKLQSGIYKIEVLKGADVIGGCRIRLK